MPLPRHQQSESFCPPFCSFAPQIKYFICSAFFHNASLYGFYFGTLRLNVSDILTCSSGGGSWKFWCCAQLFLGGTYNFKTLKKNTAALLTNKKRVAGRRKKEVRGDLQWGARVYAGRRTDAGGYLAFFSVAGTRHVTDLIMRDVLARGGGFWGRGPLGEGVANNAV